ncbi:MAG: protein kinase [Pyrinomonadaceae bacterium]
MIGQTLLHYSILEKLGAGGQGAVYKAVDAKLGRTVVIKVLAPELTAKQANLKRFEREARLASSLDHPNICTIFDLNEVNGTHFIVMQHVEGRNVRQLVNGRPLELVSALSIAVQVADALAAAHRRGIIHRDIKAGNVMVTDAGTVKVLDFGLAKLLDEETARERDIHRTELTEFGVPYGTATYAAPEQARGDAQVDARADVFSTGVLLYEMLTGTWPFRGKTSIDVRHAVLHADPPPIAEARRDDFPLGLQQIVNRALQKEPRDRYQKMEDFRDDLRRVLSESLAAAKPEAMAATTGFDSSATVIGAAQEAFAPRHLEDSGIGALLQRAQRWLRNLFDADPQTSALRTQTQSPRAQSTLETPLHLTSDGIADARKSIAILPFKNLNSDPETAFYEFSLADAVTTELARLRSLVVRPSSVIIKYQGRPVDPREAGREMNVHAVLSAGFLRAGERIRVNAQLLDVSTGAILWSDRIDGDARDIITVQDNIAQHIVEGLRLELDPDERSTLKRQAATTDATAYEEYLRGRDRMGCYIYHTLAREDVDAAIERFTRAIELDSSFALAHAALGGCYANRVLKGFGDADDYDRAKQSLDKALAIDPKMLEARMHMVFICLARGAKQQAREAVEQLRLEAPNDVGVHFVRGILARLDGEYDKALRCFDRMVRLNPAERVIVSYNRARIFMYQRRYEDALLELDQGRAMEPDHPLIRTFLARVLYYRGETDAATNLLREVVEQHPQLNGIRPIYAMCLSAQGKHAEALAQLTADVRDTAAADHDIAYWVASAYALEDEREEAFKWLERAVSLGNENRAWFESDPNWTQLRDDVRFRKLMKTISVARIA